MDWEKAEEVSLENVIGTCIDVCRDTPIGSFEYKNSLDCLKIYANRYYRLTGRCYELKIKEIENEI